SAMVIGSLVGLLAYVWIGWFVGSLVGAATSGVVFALGTWIFPDRFDFESLSQLEPTPALAVVEG
ncbi:MAG: hypothetical protein KDA51_09020, partial [Planctomycetales bacterium]|nr:hypothetical protein [Planctomycetales bacterium]